MVSLFFAIITATYVSQIPYTIFIYYALLPVKNCRNRFLCFAEYTPVFMFLTQSQLSVFIVIYHAL